MTKYEKVRLSLVVIQILMTLAAPWIFVHINNQANGEKCEVVK